MNGLVVSEKGEKNIQDIAFSTLNDRSQSSLNRVSNKDIDGMFRRLNNIRLRENLKGNRKRWSTYPG